MPFKKFGNLIPRYSGRQEPASPNIAGFISEPVTSWIVGDLTRLGLGKMPYGLFKEIQRDREIPVLDIGSVQLIGEGKIKIYGDIDYIESETGHFRDGKTGKFDAVLAGIGYERDYAELVDVDQNRFEDLKISAARQKYFGRDGLYFCGYWISPRGQVREIGLDAAKNAKDIAKKERNGLAKTG